MNEEEKTIHGPVLSRTTGATSRMALRRCINHHYGRGGTGSPFRVISSGNLLSRQSLYAQGLHTDPGSPGAVVRTTGRAAWAFLKLR